MYRMAHTRRVGQNRKYTPHMTVYMMKFLSKIPYTPYIYGSGQPYTYPTHTHTHARVPR